MRIRLLLAAAACAFFASATSLAFAGDTEIPGQLRVAILMKVLAYDRGLAARTKDGLKLAVVYDPKNSISRDSRDSFESAFKEAPRTLDGTTVEMVDMPEDGFDNAAKVGDLDIVVICSGANLARATAIAKNYKLISFAPDEGAVRNGVAVGLVPRDGKPKLLINVNASLAVNMSLDPQILRLAELIQ